MVEYEVKAKLTTDTTELDYAISRVEKLNELIKEANSIMGELAKKTIEIDMGAKTLD